jgi:hypothetical protein
MPADDLPVVEFAFPGPLRDQLVAAILAGEKTTTTGLVADYEHENEPLPVPGLRQAVVDSAGSPVAGIETTTVRVMRHHGGDLLADVPGRGAGVLGRVPGVGRVGEVGVAGPEDEPHHRVPGPVDLPPAVTGGRARTRSPGRPPAG